MDRILMWNVRGVNNQRKHRDIKELMNLKKPGLVSLLETKVKNKDMVKLYTSLFTNWCFTSNNAWMDKGRIVLAWDPNIFTLNIKRCTSQLIHCIAYRCQNKVMFQLTLVYAFNDEVGRTMLWNDLEDIAKEVQEPWAMMGDFNDVFSQEERMGRRVVRNLAGNFRRCAEACKLEDLKYTGIFFTWSNKQQAEDRVYAKLDRVLVNSLWQGKFDNSEAVFYLKVHLTTAQLLFLFTSWKGIEKDHLSTIKRGVWLRHLKIKFQKAGVQFQLECQCLVL